MNIKTSNFNFFLGSILLIAFSNYAFAGLQKHNLQYGISISIPKSWYVFTEQEVFNLKYDKNDSKHTVLAANSSIDNTKALVRVSYLKGQEFTNADIIDATDNDVQQYGMMLQEIFTNLGSPKLRSNVMAQKYKLNNYNAIYIYYDRESKQNRSSTWRVNMIQVPYKNDSIIITLSYDIEWEVDHKNLLQSIIYSIGLK